MTTTLTAVELMDEAVILPIAPPFLWTIDRYHQAIKAGVLSENDRVELLFGQLIPKMPIGEPHADCLSELVTYFTLKYKKSYKYWPQNPITLPNESEPEPDLAIVTAKSYTRATGHPTAKDILLLIEISDETLRYDRTYKARAYAMAGIVEYWIINVKDRQVEVRLSPDVAINDYNSIIRYAEGTSFESPFNGNTFVNDLLPPAE